MTSRALSTRCCVVGGGPAGMMLGFLLARAGIDVTVLEKHADFLRDFRGDTIHPSTLELMHELGLLTDFLRLPHQEVRTLAAQFGDTELTVADFSHLPTRCRFIALMPQWDFLDFLAEQGQRYPGFHLLMRTEATDLVTSSGAVHGVLAASPDGPLDIRADLVVACDGRHSLMREKAGLAIEELGAPMDVFWFRVSRHPGDPDETKLMFAAGHILILLDRGDYWQCAHAIPKGSADEVRRRGLPAMRDAVAGIAPFLRERLNELTDWDQIKLLSVRVDRLKDWYRPGLLCIGDAAHAMSPIGGVGVNLAVQDAVAAANILAGALHAGPAGPDLLARVQQRRELPARLTQAVQVFIQNRLIANLLGNTEQTSPPFAFRLLKLFPILRRLPARLVGLGVRPEHIHTPDVGAREPRSGGTPEPQPKS
ncbi:MAG TPA: FAD-dependent oxidoreductase [Xanthobacteraceae bacterium]|nr:FAD-dependent oxidoreductase [Xanthobacteraceae bacterium]